MKAITGHFWGGGKDGRTPLKGILDFREVECAYVFGEQEPLSVAIRFKSGKEFVLTETTPESRQSFMTGYLNYLETVPMQPRG